jgi:spore maturation protein CgeB
MRVAFHYPFPDTIYGHRTIYSGFRHAFEDLGHAFIPIQPGGDDVVRSLERQEADLFITSSHFLYRRYIDYERLARLRARGLFVLTRIDFWDSPLGAGRINEAASLKSDREVLRLIRAGLLGDACYHVVEQGDARMAGFTEATGATYHTIPLAADRTLMGQAVVDPQYRADVSFVGTCLPEKRAYFERMVFPLAKRYRLRLYGQDWTRLDRALGLVQKVGQYFNIPLVRSLQKPKLELGDEARIYASTAISINVHEAYQRRFGGDCNERTFKVPLFGGFEISDDVACIRRYFDEGREIVLARNETEWFEKIDHYLRHPEERLPIIEAGRVRVLRDHTYHNRARQMIAIVRGGGPA